MIQIDIKTMRHHSLAVHKQLFMNICKRLRGGPNIIVYTQGVERKALLFTDSVYALGVILKTWSNISITIQTSTIFCMISDK